MEELKYYKKIDDEIFSLKNNYSCLKDKNNDYIFNVLCLKNAFYKNPNLKFNDEIISESVVDGVNDGGIDFLISDPNSDNSDLILAQCKHYSNVSKDEVISAIHKLVDAFKKLNEGHYEDFKEMVPKRFLNLISEVGEESKIIFCFFASAQKNKINIKTLNNIVKDAFNNDDKYELRVFFDEDICNDIDDSKSKRETVENGILKIDSSNNYLSYDDDNAVVANISAFSLKQLYANNGINLFAQNLRYFIKKKDIDDAIGETIRNSPDSFWYKNNGLTIVCQDFRIDGREIHLNNFSIVNGGQTTTLIYKSKDIDKDKDFYLQCKIIKNKGSEEEDKRYFVLDISKATNSQKAIKQVDLKANAPEQIRFGHEMENIDVQYITKRGENIKRNYKDDYKNTNLDEAGKLGLAGIFCLPATCRNKPSSMYNEKFYNIIFQKNPKVSAAIIKDLLYANYYFQKKFLSKYDENTSSEDYVSFAHVSRTICLSFLGLSYRYLKNEFNPKEFISNINDRNDWYDNYFYNIFKNIDGFKRIFKKDLYESKRDELDAFLFDLFKGLINEGASFYSYAKANDPSLNASNYLKKDINFYSIIKSTWDKSLKTLIEKNKDLFEL